MQKRMSDGVPRQPILNERVSRPRQPQHRLSPPDVRMTLIRSFALLGFVLLLGPVASAGAQVVETDPSTPVRTDVPVTITFYADRGNEGLEDCECEVYAHTGLNTSEGDWRYVMDEWATNRAKTKLEQVDENTYELTIPDIREYYSDNNTGFGSVPPESEEEIQELAFVFRNADGSLEGKAAGGGDIYVDVNDVEGTAPDVSVTLQSPSADPPLYPFVTPTDTTVDVSVVADTANVDTFEKLRLLVDGQPVDSTTSTSLSYPLSLADPGRFQVRAEVRASVGDSNLTDAVETLLVRSPDVVNQDRPSGIENGINYNSDGSVTLSLFAPEKQFAYVIGDFTDWVLDGRYFMKREQTPDGTYWWIRLDGLDPSTQYDFQYYVGGTSRDVRISDPFSHKVRTPVDGQISEMVYPELQPYPDDKTENYVSVLFPDDQGEDFQFSDFDPPKQEDLVIYELLLRDFVEENSFRVLADTLSYLNRLGVNAVELLPVSNFEGNGFWGYRPSSHLAMDKSYGPPEGLKRFVEEAHRRGIAVILDVVYNHITATSSIAQLYGSAAENPFLESGPNRGICGAFFQELNQGSPFIMEYIRRANEYWIEKFNVDGFRFDVAHCVADDGVNVNDPSHNDALKGGWKSVADSIWDVDPDTYVTLELFAEGNVANELGGYGGQGNTGGMLTWNNMYRQYSRADRGDVEEGSDLSSSYYQNRDGFDQPSSVTYMTSHDEQWLMRWKKARGNSNSGYSTQDFGTALDRQKLVGAFFFTVPGPRLMWQFGEVGYGWGPGECLRGFRGENVCPSSAPRRIGPKPIRWEYADPQESPGRVKLYKTWKALIRLRNNNEVFSQARTSSGEEIKMKVGNGETLRCLRLEDESLDATIIGNFGLSVQTASLPVGPREGACSFPQTGTWHNFFEADTLQVTSSRQVRLRPGEFRVYTSMEQAPPPMGLVPGAPVHRTTESEVSNDRTVDFGTTGVDITFRGTSGTGAVTVEKVEEAPYNPVGTGEGSVSDVRFVVTSTGNLRFTDQTEVRFNTGSIEGIDNPGALTIYHRPAEHTGSLAPLQTSYDEDSSEVVARADSTGEFVLVSGAEPARINVGLSARLTSIRTVELTWSANSESTANVSFQVQRRATDSWNVLGSSETSGAQQHYRYLDRKVPLKADSVHYRLERMAPGEGTRVSKVVTVELGPPDVLTLAVPYPNPAAGQATVQYGLPERQTVRLRLFDVLGREVMTVVQDKQEGRHEQPLDLSDLSSGVYFLRLQAGDQSRTRKLTVVD